MLLMPWLLVVAGAPVTPATNPLLRLETGMHTGKINALAVDPSGKWVVTAGDDKTIRVWGLPSGELLRVIRLPIEAASDEGRVEAVALSPDGEMIAAGGYLGKEYGQSSWIALFRRANGEMVRRLGGFFYDVSALAFSRDGKRVAGAGAYAAPMVFDVDSAKVLFTAEKHRGVGATHWHLSFGAGGEFVAGTDSSAQVYDANGVVDKRRGPWSEHLHRSLDGRWLVRPAGDPRGSLLEVFSVSSLESLFDKPLVVDKGVADGLFTDATLTPDGQTLVASRWQKDAEIHALWLFGQGGKASGIRIPISATATVEHVEATRDGIVWASERGWGYVDFGLTERVVHNAPSLRWAVDMPDRFAPTPNFVTNAAGSEVFVGPKLGKPFAVVPKERTVRGVERLPAVKPRPTDFPIPKYGFGIRSGYVVAPDGEATATAEYDQLSVTDAGLGFGVTKTRWIHHETPTNLVHWSDNGRVVVAVFEGGVLRWFRAADGELLLSWFAVEEGRRWVAWTKSGFYDASPDGEDLVGWHVNRGLDAAADFYPASLLRKHFYRPDIVSRVLDTLDEQKAIAASKKRKSDEGFEFLTMQPPVVSFIPGAEEMSATGPTIRLKARVKVPSGAALKRLTVLVDGRQIANSRGVQPKITSDEVELEVPIPARDCVVSVFAETHTGAGAPVSVRVKWHGPAQTADAFTVKPTLYVLAIGVARYKDPVLRLDLAAKDAKDVAAALAKQDGALYKRVESRLLTDERATRDEIMDGLEWLQKNTTQHDVAILFLAGHGIKDPQNDQFYFLPYDADTQKVKRTMVADTDIRSTAAAVAGKMLVFLDACHAGSVVGKPKFRGLDADINGFVNELASADNGVVVFTSSSGRQLSQESEEWKNGAFTLALIEGLSGAADAQKSGRVTVNMLDLYVSERVKALTKGSQTPTTAKPTTVQDFPIAIRF
ncbi:MAG: caspase family protein [Deltaproteobacteria bacterium]|nr:caspase family protein [Deltaproteobacteria bacterium]